MAATEQEQDGPPLTELESLQLKANNITDESLDSTRRMIQLCEDSQAAGTKTLVLLERQGEQLNRVEEGLDAMNSEMKQAERHIIGLEKWCGIFVCPWGRGDLVKAEPDASWNGSKAASGKDGPGKASAVKRGKSPSGGGGAYIRRITEDAREDEMEENMQAVGNVLGNLTAMARDMGGEIEAQNRQIERVTAKSQTVDIRIETANRRTEKLLK